MIRYAVNTGLIFTDRPLSERVRAARDAGFHAIESFWPEPHELDGFIAAVEETQMNVALINVSEGDYRVGERGFAAHPERRTWWRDAMTQAFDLAERVQCPNLNVLTGYVEPDIGAEAMRACLVENLHWAAPRAAALGIDLLLEPLNARTHPGYVCTTIQQALDLIAEVGSPRIGVQFDCYQVGGGEGRVIERLTEALPAVRHIQIADVPDRGEPGTGELDFDAILAAIDRLPYDGYVGLEYIPTREDPFEWLPYDHR